MASPCWLALLCLGLVLLANAGSAVVWADPGAGEKGGKARGRVDAAVEERPGLQVVSVGTLQGRVVVHLPNHLAPGDTLSGRVMAEPAGRKPREVQRNAQALEELVVELGEEAARVEEGVLQAVIPASGVAGTVDVIFRTADGFEVARTPIAVRPQAGRPGLPRMPTPDDFETPVLVQSGDPLVIRGPFDGDFATTGATLGPQAQELVALAESPRQLILQAPENLVGPNPLTVSEGGVTVTRIINVVRLYLSAGKLDLWSGETTVVNARVEGFAQLDPRAYPIPFEMVNHSPAIIRFESVEGESFRHQIQPEDVSAEGVYEFATVIRGLRPGGFHIAAKVFAPELLEIQDAPPACGEETRLNALCVRFFVVDECGARKQPAKTGGLLAGADYGGKNFGQLPPKAVGQLQAILELANQIWLQCLEHCCWIRFYCDDGKRPCVYAFDPQGVPATYVRTRKIGYKPEGFVFKGWQAKQEKQVDLCQFFDKNKPRSITTDGGNRPATITQSVTWEEDVGREYKKGDSADPVIQEKAAAAEDDKEKKRWEDLLRKNYQAPAVSVLETFGDAVDQALEERCINIFILNVFEDTKEPGDEAGFGTLGGRNVFLEEGEVAKGSGQVLAHELGHNLGLDHTKAGGNLMNPDGSGTTLTRTQCDQACDGARGKGIRPARLPDDEAKKRKAAEDEKRRKEEEESRKKEEEESRRREEEERRKKRLAEIDQRLAEMEPRIQELEESIRQAEEKFRKTVEGLSVSQAEKDKILKDNLPNVASKEKAELKKLQAEKAALEKERQGLK